MDAIGVVSGISRRLDTDWISKLSYFLKAHNNNNNNCHLYSAYSNKIVHGHIIHHLKTNIVSKCRHTDIQLAVQIDKAI